MVMAIPSPGTMKLIHVINQFGYLMALLYLMKMHIMLSFYKNMEQYAKTGETEKYGKVTLVKKMAMVWVLVKQLQSAIIQNIGFPETFSSAFSRAAIFRCLFGIFWVILAILHFPGL